MSSFWIGTSYCTNNQPYCRAALPDKGQCTAQDEAYGRHCTSCRAYYPWSAEHHRMEMHVKTGGFGVGARHEAHCQSGHCAAVAHDAGARYGWHALGTMTVPWPKTLHFCPDQAVDGMVYCTAHKQD